VAAVDTVSLTYDALGRVVEQKRGSSYTEIVYTPGGGKLALMNGQTLQQAFCALPGGETAVYNSSGLAYYRHGDWLGSSRLASTAASPTSVYADTEYAPYGEVYGASGTPDYNFTGKNQDTVSNSNAGLYDFMYREYSPVQGRWISPDPAGMGAVSATGPQSLNRYGYVGNGPLNSADAFGLFRDRMELFGMSGGIDPLLDPGGAWLAAETQQFMVAAGLDSPMAQGARIYQAQVDCAFNPGSCPKGVPGTPGGPALVPGGAIYGSYSNKYGAESNFLLGTIDASVVLPDESLQELKNAVRARLTGSSKCGALYKGGLGRALVTLQRTQYINVESLAGFSSNPNTVAFTYGLITWLRTGGFPNFSMQAFGLQTTILLHELRHGSGYRGEIDQNYVLEYQTIESSCPGAH
jgi:RHS repeat-associated protein